MAAVVLLIGARPGKGELLLRAVVAEALVDELTAVVRVNTKEDKGDTLPHPMHGGAYPLLTFTPDWQALRPATGHVYSTKRVQVKTLYALPTVAYQVYFHKSGLVLLPIGKGPDGYGALKQASWPGTSESPSTPHLPAWLQQPVDGGGTDPAESHFRGNVYLQLIMSPEYSYHLRNKGL